MVISTRLMKWLMRFYPPLLFQRIWTVKFHEDFMGVDVKIFRSPFNINYNKSIFGGTIYAAVDPFYAVLFHQLLSHRKYKIMVWQKAAEIEYLKPGYKNLHFSINLSENEISELCSVIDSGEKFIKGFPVEIFDSSGALCAKVNSVIYVRKLHD